MSKAVIIMGSDKDMDHAKRIGDKLASFDVRVDYRVASAHKTPEHVSGILESYDSVPGENMVYIAVAGRTDALAGYVACSTSRPSLACPPPADSPVYLNSSLFAPSDCPVMVVADPGNAALAVVKILATVDKELGVKYAAYAERVKSAVIEADRKLNSA